jgi:organic radical activating enzyme
MQVKDIDTTKELPIMEYFYTIQGEGSYAGRAAFFIRLAGCDVGCVWCDVKESWNANEHPLLTIDFIIEEVVKSTTNFVVITGGEPAMYDLTTLTHRLKELDIEIAIETSGTYPLIGHIDWYCFSPKKFKKPVQDAYDKAAELKVIINHPSDFEFAELHASMVNSDCKLYLQPEWSKQDRFLPEIIAYVKRYPQWRISLQTHKFMQIP